MNSPNMRGWLTNFRSSRSATSDAIREFESSSEFVLPKDYVQFLQHTNGGEGFVGAREYLILWPLEELLKMNQAYQVAEYAPELFLFGSNGGGEAYAFDKRSPSSVVSVPFVGMNIGLAQRRAADFQEFIESLYNS